MLGRNLKPGISVLRSRSAKVKGAMNKWILRVSLAITFAITLIKTADIYQRLNIDSTGVSAFEGINQGFLAVLGFICAAGGVLLVWSFVGKKFDDAFTAFICRKRSYWLIAAVFALLFLESAQDLFYLNAGLKEVYYPVSLLQNQDLLIWAAIISGQSLLAWLVLGWMASVYQFPSFRSFPYWLVIIFLAAGISYLAGGMGSLPSNAPLPFIHVLLVLLSTALLGKLVKWFSTAAPRIADFIKKDFLVFIVLWVIAFSLWANVPLQSNYFIDPPRPPNYEYTPTSDAIYYEIQSQRLLAGEGFEEEVQHSFYNYILSGLHALGGAHYLDIYKLQIGILAVLPFLFYKLAKSLFSSYSGWLLSLLVIIREYNALHLGDSITVSNVQELMTEPFAMLGVVLFLYLCVLWVKDKRGNWGKPALIGAVVAATALIRVELLSLAFVFGVLSLGRYWKQKKDWLISTGVFILSLVLILSPLLARNYQQTGRIMIDKGVVLVQTAQDIFEGPSETGDDPNTSIFRNIPGTIRRLSLRVWHRSTTSITQTLVYLPSNHFPLGGLDTFIDIIPEKGKVRFFQTGLFSDDFLTRYIKSLPYWKVRWDGGLTARSILPQLLVLGLISSGVYQLYRKERVLSVLPLITMLIHILVYSLVGYSGGRYIQVVDWITLMYFCIGLASLVQSVLKIEQNREIDGDDNDSVATHPQSNWADLSWAVGVFLVILSMPVVEAVVEPRYSEEAVQSVIEEYRDDLKGEDCLVGAVQYPGFYGESERFLDDRSGHMPEAGINQMVFFLIGSENVWISLPSEEPLDGFAHGSEAVICGSMIRDTPQDLANRLHPYFLANQVKILGEETSINP